MNRYSLTHLADATLLREADELAATDRRTTAWLLAHIAEIDARKLYLPQAYPSMRAYCVGRLRLSDNAARKHVHAAHAARDFPTIFDAVADGRLHLSSVLMIAPYLRPENADELITEAALKTRFELEAMLACRFPKSDVLALVTPVSCQCAPGRIGSAPPDGQTRCAPGRIESVAPARTTPLSADSYAIQGTVSRHVHERLGYLQSLLGHRFGPDDFNALLEYATEAGIEKAEKRKLGATDRPHKPRPCHGERTIPAHVRREVWNRDGGQCTFVSESGRRCEERSRLEFDHEHPVARGGRATVGQIRLRCRAHNQFTAEQAFGVGFMREKRRAAAEAKAAREESDVTPYLRRLGFSAAEARRAAGECNAVEGASLETRMRAALAHLRPHAPVTRPPSMFAG